jgi:hypothetical protein
LHSVGRFTLQGKQDMAVRVHCQAYLAVAKRFHYDTQ